MNLIFLSNNQLCVILIIYNFYFLVSQLILQTLKQNLSKDFSQAIFIIFPKIKLQTKTKVMLTQKHEKNCLLVPLN